MKIIVLIITALSLVLFADVSRSNDMVSDSFTKLQWQDNTTVGTKNWESALTYCENLSLNTHNDWRLPNLNELTSIVDRSKDSPAIVDIFVNTQDSTYWSSTTYEHSKTYAWFVHFGTGSVENNKLKTTAKYVRCVRNM